MAVPGFHALKLPVFKAGAKGEVRLSDLGEKLAENDFAQLQGVVGGRSFLR
jgi:hypothetical protein